MSLRSRGSINIIAFEKYENHVKKIIMEELETKKNITNLVCEAIVIYYKTFLKH